MDNDSINEKTLQDVHTKEIDLVNRDPKHLNDDVVKVQKLFLLYATFSFLASHFNNNKILLNGFIYVYLNVRNGIM